jgi:GTPase SAR1 family protein
MMPLYFRDVSAVILVADVTSPSSWTFIQSWIEKQLPEMHPAPLLFLCLNKTDLPEHDEIGKFVEWATSEQSFPILKTSAQSGANVAELFRQVATHLVQVVRVQPEPQGERLSRTDAGSGDGCC